MCKPCVDAVREIYPDCPEKEIGNLLICGTPFPAGNTDDVRKCLLEAKAAGCKTWREAIVYADECTTKAMEEAEHEA